jgi:O-antigen/teichoic acid export membrane protein
LEGLFVSDLGAVTDTLVVPDSASAKRREARASRKGYGKTAKVGALWSIGRESVTQMLGIPTALLLARLLTPADFGIAAAATFFIQLGKKLGNMGLNTSLVRMKDVREEHRASVFCINMVFGIVAWTTLMLVAPWIGTFYADDRVTGAVRVAATIFLVNFFGAVEYAVLQREMKFKEMAFVEWTGPVLFMPIAVTMAWTGWGYWSLIVAHVISNAASTCSKVYYGRWRPSLAVTRTGLAETVPFGLGIYAKRLLMYAAENLDSLIVGGLFGVTWLGFYDKAFNAAANMSNRLAVGSSVMLRIFALIQEDRDRFVRAYAKVIIAATLTTLPVFAGLIVAAREFILVVFGEQWLPAVVPFQLLCVAGAVRALGGYSSAVVQANGQIWSEVWRRVAYVALVGASIYAFRAYGIQGAATGVLLATAVMTVLMQDLVRRILGLTWWEINRPLVPGVGNAIGTAAIVAMVTAAARSATLADWQVLVLQAAAGGLFWITFVLFARFRLVQDVVDEVLDDLMPSAVRRVVNRIRPQAQSGR